MEEFDPEKAAARASEAGKWIELWRTKTEIRMRTEEAAAWIANFRAATNARERAARIQERAQWIANWRSVSERRRAFDPEMFLGSGTMREFRGGNRESFEYMRPPAP